MRILVDVDDTLTDFLEKRNNLIAKYISDHNLPYKIIDINNPTSAKVADWPREECIKFWHEVGADEQLLCPTQEAAAEVVRKLKSMGHVIIIVTARPDDYFPARSKTEEWLKKHGIPYDRIITNMTDKKQVMQDLNIQLAIDDSIKTCTFASELGIPSLLFTTVANSALIELPKLCIRVESWQKIKELFNKSLFDVDVTTK